MVELKLNLGLQVIGEYWSQIDLILRVKLTWYWESNWLDIESRIDLILRVELTWYWESNWLDIESRIDLILRVELTWYWESNWLDIESLFDSNILQLLGISGRILFREWLTILGQNDSIFSFSSFLMLIGSFVSTESNWNHAGVTLIICFSLMRLYYFPVYYKMLDGHSYIIFDLSSDYRLNRRLTFIEQFL